MPWNDNEMEKWIATVVENARVQPNASRMLLSIVDFESLLVALCPLCPDAAIFTKPDMGPRLHTVLQNDTVINGVKAYVVRSPCDVHNDCQGGWLSADESSLFEAHARSFATFASGVTVLARATTSLQLCKVTRQQLLLRREQLCVHSVKVTSGERCIEACGGKDSTMAPGESRVNTWTPENVD